jgi:hypothetical protein
MCSNPRASAVSKSAVEVLHRCRTDRVHDDEARYLLALQKHLC